MNPEHFTMDIDADKPRRSVPAAVDMAEAVVRARLNSLRKLDLQQALPLLLLELDRILHAQLGPEHRVALLECIKKPVLKAAAGLPKPASHGREGAQRLPAGMTLEQRLLLMMTRNLRHALYEIDRSQSSLLVEDDGDRVWVLLQVFRFLGRQVRYGIDWDRPWPKHTWQDLHDLFVYLVVRGSVQVNSGFTVAAFDDEFDAEIEYKRLLLLGLADRLTDRRSRTADFFHLLKRWAVDTRLVEPERAIGQERVIKVEVIRDEPPRLREAKLAESFRGWVLRPADAFVDYVRRVNRDGGQVVRLNAFRTAPSSRF